MLGTPENMNEMVRERNAKEERLRDLERQQQVPEDELTRKVERAIERLSKMRAERVDGTDRQRIDSLLRKVVVRGEVFFKVLPGGQAQTLQG